MYQPTDVSLAVATAADVEIVKPGILIGEIAILDVPDGGELYLKIGKNPDYIRIKRPATFAPDNDNDANYGLYAKVVNPLAGGLVQVVVSWGGKLNALLI